ncbi:signal peptidase [Olivibacter sp. XZL3]|uniref:signal peptidase n=1 Tax=Olivibacter sp. XZL3 TaxID=1735116 RepID=UPI0010658C55|nr:signal peptidase [Olivibacter sp. XZL3]
MNKYLKRGIAITVIGVLVCMFGMYLKGIDSSLYGLTLTLGVIVFGIGFVTIVYSLMRKIERQSILESRDQQRSEKEEN